MIRVCVAGVTGWVGRSLVPAIVGSKDLRLVGAVARKGAGRALSALPGFDELRGAATGLRVCATVAEALAAETDVLIDYTAPDSVKGNVLEAASRRVHSVVGTSGLDDSDYAEIARAAEGARVGVLAGANFAISAVLLEHFAAIAARFMPSWEIIDYAKADKPDAPSGTARGLANRLAQVRASDVGVPISATQGMPESRGATLSGTQVHAIRLPGHIIGAEVLFGMPSERLSLRYDGGSGAEPYVAGTLLAVRNVSGFVGLRRGLGSVMGLE